MKDKQYTQLLSTVTALKITLELTQVQILNFIPTCNSYCKDTNNRLNMLKDKLSPAPALASTQELIQEINKLRQNFKKNIETPLLDYRKTLDKTEKTIEDKVNKILAKGILDGARLQNVQHLLQQSKTLLLNSQQNLDQCFAEFMFCQRSIAQIDNDLQNLNLPNTIAKIIEDITKLDLQLNTSPQREQYQTAMLPLITALSKLTSVDFSARTEEEEADKPSTPRATPL